MIRNFSLSAAIALGTFLPTLALLAPDAAQAKYRRITAVTSCNPDSAANASFSGSGLKVNLSTGNVPTGTGIRCQVPTDSYLRHDHMTEAHVSGKKNASNGWGSYVKACSTWYQSGSYTCGGTHTVASGNFNRIVNLGNAWSHPHALPMITAVLGDGDKLYGVYYTDS